MDVSLRTSLYVVVLNWNLPNDTIACLVSLINDGFPIERILVVDNGSTDNSIERITAVFSQPPQILRSETNRGFAGGNNLGIRRALELGASWVWLLNNDTIVPQGTCAQMQRAIATHPEYALISPLIVYHDQPQQVWSLGRRNLPGTLLTYEALHAREIPGDLPEVVEVDSLTACALLVRAEVFEKVGLLDEGYFMYGEDGDFCWRARRVGYRFACWTPARILHKVSRSSGTGSPTGRRWRAESMARFYRIHGNRAQSLIHLPFTLARTAFISLIDLLAGRSDSVAAGWQGWRTGWFGKVRPPAAPTFVPLESLKIP